MKIQIFAYPGMTLFDLAGPLQVWSLWSGAEVQIVSEDRRDLLTDARVVLHATHSLEEAWQAPDLLFVPGASQAIFDLLENDRIIEFLAQQAGDAGWVTSVCTGSLLLAAAGALDGYKATSHWLVRDLLQGFGAEVVPDRWVIDRNRATGGGVTAGIDFGLAVMAEVSGDENLAKFAQLILEYAPQPPFTSGTPETAEPHIRTSVDEHFRSENANDRARQLAMAYTRFQHRFQSAEQHHP